MNLIYNLIQLTGLILLFPFIFVKIILSPKYRGLVPRRLGLGLAPLLDGLEARPGPRIWIHALSVGEVTSALPLVEAIRRKFKTGTIIFSTTTLTGETLARERLKGLIDIQIPFPIDLLWVSRRFIRLLAPDIFILVETDFWPNFLGGLTRKKIPALLVNGRISEASFAGYRKLKPLFTPLFSSFAFISMQTAADAERMQDLVKDRDRVAPLGNLKYDAARPTSPGRDRNPAVLAVELGIRPEHTVWVAGSTHPGEEEIILAVYKRLLPDYPTLFLIIAPRQVERGRELVKLAADLSLEAGQRSAPGPGAQNRQILILDTIGELAATYEVCDIAYVGGSMVAAGGHNPLEAAVFAKPVFFGPHMEDFREIAVDLATAQGTGPTTNEEELFAGLQKMLADQRLRKQTGRRAGELVAGQQGVTDRHLTVINRILNQAALK